MSLVSVVVAAYNAEDTLERAVRSVAAQTHPDWELLIADDGSTDGTRALALALAEEIGERVIVLPEAPNGGPSAARNRALEVMRGEWVAFLDADDEFAPDRLQRMLDAAGEQTDVVVSRHYLLLPRQGRLDRGHDAGTVSGEEALRQLLVDLVTPYMADKLFRAAAVADVRCPPIRRAEDKVYVAAAFRRARTVSFIDGGYYLYHLGEESLTWGRVASREETVQLNTLIEEAAGPAFRAQVQTSAVSAWLNVANQGAVSGDARAARQHGRMCSGEIPWRGVLSAARVRPVFAAAATALKLAPGLYAAVYRRYARGHYGVGAPTEG